MEQAMQSHLSYQKGVAVKFEPYVLSKFVCPGCQKRYGEPSEDGFMEVIRCEKCVRKKDIDARVV